jgi:hypothetical protein
VLSDVQIAAMSPAERRDLIQRLQRPLDEVFPPPVARRMRRNRLTLMVGGAIVLIPWIVYLGFTLPANYVAHNWPATWIVVDGLLLAFMAATAVLGWLRRQVVVLPAFTTVVGVGADRCPRQPAARGDPDHRGIADPATDSDTALVSRPRDPGVAPAVGAVTGTGAT